MKAWTSKERGDPIRSAKNSRIQTIRSLHTAKGRKESGFIAAEGPKLVTEALEAGWTPAFALADPSRGMDEALLHRLEQSGAEILLAEEAAMAAASDVKTPQWIIAAFAMQEAQPLRSPLLALDGVQDPGNVGTMLRTALACGFGGVLLGQGCADPFSPKALRATMGAAFRLPARSVGLAEALTVYKKEGYHISIAAADGQDAFARRRRDAPSILVIGSEGSGVSAQVRALADAVLAIPMAEGAESFNAAVAAGILLYDWYRRGDGRVPKE